MKVFIAFVTGDFGTFVPKAPSVAGGILSKSPSAHWADLRHRPMHMAVLERTDERWSGPADVFSWESVSQ